jgi:sulfatase modifying factor 1
MSMERNWKLLFSTGSLFRVAACPLKKGRVSYHDVLCHDGILVLAWTEKHYNKNQPNKPLVTLTLTQNNMQSFTLTRLLLLLLSLLLFVAASSNTNTDDNDDELGANLDPHPDPNDEHYEGMIYVGRHCNETGRRLSKDHDNSVTYLFGTSFVENTDATHNEQHQLQQQSVSQQDLPQRRRHLDVIPDALPKPFGHVGEHALDGGVTPPKLVSVEPFFLDATLVTNRAFAAFVAATSYETEAEQFGWSFVLESFVNNNTNTHYPSDPESPHWMAVPGAYWRRPEGPQSSYKFRHEHPVVHVSHRDAAEYCKWKQKRLPGEYEWEAAARGCGSNATTIRTIYSWGDSVEDATKHANLWDSCTFPFTNDARDGWRGTSPVLYYPPNSLGFHDVTGNVWEWMRGGKHKARILRGASYADSLDGSFNHAATLGARSTLHATTTAGNVGFRCAKSPKRRVEYHWTWHDESEDGTLAVEDQFGKRDYLHPKGWEDQLDPNMFRDDDDGPVKRKKVVKKVERLSTEL